MMDSGIALVTGRGGSKRIPGKNVRLLAGRPLIAWSVEAAKQARSITRVLVSTDDAAIAEAAQKAGGSVPFLRPAELSGDHSSHVEVIAHALDWYERAEGGLPELVCLLQPTSPLRTGADIDSIIALVRETGADSGVAVTAASIHPAHMYRITSEGRAHPLMSLPNAYQRTQDLEPYYYVNGAAYVIRPETFRQRKTVLSVDPVAYVMPVERSIDIDDEDDFAVAESLMKSRLMAAESS